MTTTQLASEITANGQYIWKLKENKDTYEAK